jgi:acyl-CoA synthetase (NDP forming)
MAQQRTDLDHFFNPNGTVIIGRVDGAATATVESLHERYDRFGTRWYLVNPKGGMVAGSIPIYTSVLDIADDIELAVINVNPAAVPAVIDQVGEKGIKYALVFTSGFSEVGAEGAAIERDLGERAAKWGIRVFGPNTNTNAFEPMPDAPGNRGGKIGLLTQSGHNGRPLVQGGEFGVGFSRWVPTGNEVDLELGDFLEYFAYDPDTQVIGAYVEGFKSADQLRIALQAANDNDKPVVMLKIGETEAGARMASSHTGHLTGSDAVVNGLFAQHAVTRVSDLDELLDTAALFSKLPVNVGPNVCMYSISGGSGTLMMEQAEKCGIALPELTEETQRKLHEIIPAYLTVSNPVDNGGSLVRSITQEKRLEILDLVANDPNVDVIVVGLTAPLGAMTEALANDVRVWAPTAPVPVIVTWNSYKIEEPAFTDVVMSGVPTFRSFRNCFRALRAYYDYQERRPALHRRVASGAVLSDAAAGALVGGGTLDADAARVLLESFGVPLVGEHVAHNVDDAVAAAERFGYPVVMKIASADFPHKSDVGLVRVGVADADEVRVTFAEFVARAQSVNPSARIDGVLVQQMVREGTEMIVGITHDSQLGAAVMVGTGGIFAEVLRDVAVRPVPLDEQDAREMIDSLRGVALLRGARGRAAGDIDALVQVILSVARLAEACGDQLAELDLNPVIVSANGAVAVDNLVVAGDPSAPAAGH